MSWSRSSKEEDFGGFSGREMLRSVIRTGVSAGCIDVMLRTRWRKIGKITQKNLCHGGLDRVICVIMGKF